jgi:hypothetical protein
LITTCNDDYCVPYIYYPCKYGDFETYLQEVRTHRFCLCPPGRGIDIHRTWETLMVGTIPIVISGPLDHLFKKLPVISISDWSIITESYSQEKYEEIRKSAYDFSILYSDYWKQLLEIE